MGTGMSVHWHAEELPEVRQLLDRAMNTWEPKQRPAWVQELSDRLDRIIFANNPPPPETKEPSA